MNGIAIALQCIEHCIVEKLFYSILESSEEHHAAVATFDKKLFNNTKLAHHQNQTANLRRNQLNIRAFNYTKPKLNNNTFNKN